MFEDPYSDTDECEERAEPVQDDALVRMVRYVQEKLDTRLTPNLISEALGISRENLNALCQDAFSMNVKNLVHLIRVGRARMLVERTRIKMGEIGRITRLTPSNFSKVFQNQLGITPSFCRSNSQHITCSECGLKSVFSADEKDCPLPKIESIDDIKKNYFPEEIEDRPLPVPPCKRCSGKLKI